MIKKPIQRLTLCALFALCSLSASAYDFDVDGIYYNVLSEEDLTCEVTYLYYSSSNKDAYTGDVVIPETTTYLGKTYSVVAIGDYAFYDCSSMTSISIPNSVTIICNYSFTGCDGLTELTIPDSVIEIGRSAFNSCHGLTELTIPDSVIEIGKYSFNNCPGILYISLGKNLKTIEGAFVCQNLISIHVSEENQYFCDKEGVLYSKDMKTLMIFPSFSPLLPSYYIPNSVTTICDNAFLNCTGLTSITIPDSVEYLSGFCGCTGLTSVDIPNSVTTIGGNAFRACSSLTELTIPENVTTIGDYAFAYCDGLTEMTIPENVITIGDYAFYECHYLTSVIMGNLVEKIGNYAFYWCRSLTSIKLPEALTRIQISFQHCESLTSITIPDKVDYIYGMAFYGCTSLNTLTIGKSVEKINIHAFCECTSLMSIYSLNPTPPACDLDYMKDVFEGVDKENCVLYVPSGSKSDYSTADTWQDFMNIVEMTEFAVETLAATEITDSSAILNGSVTEGYNEPVSKRGFEYWKAGSENVVTTINLDENEMSYTLNDLTPATTYFYHAFATTESGTIFGEDVSFTTLDDPSGIVGIYSDSYEVDGIYSTSGQKLNVPQHGVNIVKYSDGSTRKVLGK